MKRVTSVLAALLVMILSVSLADNMPPADPTEGSRLVGVLITMRDISPYTGEDGLLWASVSGEDTDFGPEYYFEEVGGLRLICFAVPEENGDGSSIVSNVDDGFSEVDFSLSEDNGSIAMKASVHVVPGQSDEMFFYNPVLRAEDGRVFAVPGDFVTISAEMNPPGSSVGQTIRDERRHTENGEEIVDVTEVNVEIMAAREPMGIRLLQFSKAHEILKNEEFMPGSVPEQITALAEADYLLLETEEKAEDGQVFIRREVFGRDEDYLNTVSCREDGICISHYHEILWDER